MQSRLLLNIMLLTLVIVLSMIASKYKPEDAGEATSLTSLSSRAVTDIRIHHNRREIVLHKQQDGWKMLKPILIDANDFRINTLLKLLNTTSHADYDITGLDLASYGLDQPITSVRFNDIEIFFGISSPVNGKRYVRVGDRMQLIDDSYYPLLSSQTGTLIARELLPRDADITKLVLPAITLVRNPDGSWSGDKAISTDAIRETLDNWKHTQAFGVHNYMQRETLAQIEVHIEGEAQPLRFVVTDTDPWLIIARPDLDIEYHFNLETYDGLLRPGADEKLPDDIPAELRDEIEDAADNETPDNATPKPGA